MGVQEDVVKRRAGVKKFFQLLFAAGLVIALSLAGYMYLQDSLSGLELIQSVAGLTIFFGIGFKGIDKGLDDVFQNLEFIEDNPEVLKFNFYTTLFFPVALLVLLTMPLLFRHSPLLIVLVFMPSLFALFFIGLPVLSKAAEGAIVIYMARPGLSTRQAFFKSLKYSPRYYLLWWYETLVKWAANSFVGRKFLFGITGIPQSLGSSLAQASLSYTTIIAVGEDKSALNSIIESIRKGMADPAETSFLSLGLTLVILLLSLFLVLPMLLSMALVAIIHPGTLYEIFICGIPFLLGLVVVIAVGSSVTTSAQMALLDNYMSEA